MGPNMEPRTVGTEPQTDPNPYDLNPKWSPNRGDLSPNLTPNCDLSPPTRPQTPPSEPKTEPPPPPPAPTFLSSRSQSKLSRLRQGGTALLGGERNGEGAALIPPSMGTMGDPQSPKATPIPPP